MMSKDLKSESKQNNDYERRFARQLKRSNKTYRSLKTKLYIMISGIVMVTTVAISIRNISQFRRMLEGQITIKTLSMADVSKNSIRSQFELWQVQLNQALKSIAEGNLKGAEIFTDELLKTYKEFVSVEIIEQRGQKFANILHSVVDYEKHVTKKSMSSVNYSMLMKFKKRAPSQPLYIESISKKGLTKYFNYIVPAKTGKKSYNWAIITIRNSLLKSKLTIGRDVVATVINSRGQVIVKTKRNNFRKLNIYQQAIDGKATQASRIYHKKDGDPLVGGFAWSDYYKFAVVYIRSPQNAYIQINKEVLKTIALTLGILIFAVLLGYLASVSLTKKLNSLTAMTNQIAAGKLDERISLDSNDEVGVLEFAINRMAEKISNLLSLSVEAAKKEKELLTAKAVQDTFFDNDAITTKHLNVVGTYVSAEECGGDWWGYFPISEDKDLVCIADATGHGAPAALVTAMAYSFFQTYIRLADVQTKIETDPGHLLEKLNEIFWNAGKGKTTMTFFVGVIDKPTGTLTYANAGHNFPMVFPRHPEEDKRIKKRKSGGLHSKYFQIAGKGTPLGYQHQSQYANKSLSLQDGDKLFLFTDGIIECRNPEQEMWGKTKLLRTLNRLIVEPLNVVLQQTIKEAFVFFNGQPPDDDITVVMVDFDRTNEEYKETDGLEQTPLVASKEVS